MRAKSWKLSVALILGTLVAGVGLRFGRFGLPYGIVKYGGSMCWALLIYWLASTALQRVVRATALAGLLATGIESFKLYRSPGTNAFRAAIPGILILGRYFSWWDILAYWLAIALGAVLDASLRASASGKESQS